MTLQILGDVHAGRKFINDVPVHRRGEREREVLDQLKSELDVTKEVNIHVQVGDLFDKFQVDNETVMEVATTYLHAAAKHDHCVYVVYPGNHDLSRDADKISSFQIFAMMVAHCDNIQVIMEPGCQVNADLTLGFLPWHPFKSADQLAEELLAGYPGAKFDYVFCHCDLKQFGNEHNPNIIPTKVLKGHTKTLVTGHVHTPSRFEQDGMEVIVTGSAQPFSHSEDPDHSRYLTLTLKELQAMDPALLHDKYIRLKLSPTEELIDPPDCMGLKIVSIDASDEEAPPQIEVKFEDYSTRGLFEICLREAGVSSDTQLMVLERFDSDV